MTEIERVVLCSGQEVEIYDGDNRKDIQELSNWSKEGFLKPVKGNHILLPKEFLKCDEILYNFNYRPTDIFVNGYPKSGTTWTTVIVWAILHNTNQGNPKANMPFFKVPWFEADCFKHTDNDGSLLKTFSNLNDISLKPCFVEMYEDLSNPRVIQTHLYSSIINKNVLDVSKMIYVVRDPLDSFYSYYLFHRYMIGPLGINKNLSEITDIYKRGELFCRNAVEHIRSWWPYRGHKHFYLIFYEDLKKDISVEIRKLAKFLGKELTDIQVENIIDQTSFERMKEISAKSEMAMEECKYVHATSEQESFFRKGIIGDSKNMPKDIYNTLVTYFNDVLNEFDLPYNFKLQ